MSFSGQLIVLVLTTKQQQRGNTENTNTIFNTNKLGLVKHKT